MTTLAARAINEVFIQGPAPVVLAVTFHGGDSMIGFAWGDIAHGRNSHSPDHAAMELMASAMRDWVGSVGDGVYRVGTMTDTIYPVKGGMEDWAYGGSWSKGQVVQCTHEVFQTQGELSQVCSPGLSSL